jgi:hypothetical protein
MKIKKLVFTVETRDYTEPLPEKVKDDKRVLFTPTEIEVDLDDQKKSRR